MSKILVYILDKIVWMLLITALTTQALQIAGILESPKGLEEITYAKGKEYNFHLSVGGSDIRGKRQADERSQFLDSIFNVPIQTLNAVNTLIQNTRPAFRGLRDFAVRRLTTRKAFAGPVPPESTTSTTTSTTTENLDSNLYKRSYPVYIKPREDKEKYV